MALFDIFKKKEKKEEPKKEKKLKREDKLEEKKKKIIKKDKTTEKKKAEKTEKSEEIAYDKKEKKEIITAPTILRSPHIAEKSGRLAEMNQYVFKVYPQTNKTEIKKAVEEVYGVDVLKVKMITISKKQIRVGKTFGWRKGYKKAIVLIKKGQSIEILPR